MQKAEHGEKSGKYKYAEGDNKMIKRLTSALRYLSWSDPIYNWKFSKGNCPYCGRSTFIALRKDPFMTRCLKCKANITNLSLIPVIKAHFNNDYTGKIAYELSTYGSTLTWLKNNFSKVVTSEYFPNYKPGELVDGVLNQDVQLLTFEDNSFDVVTSNHVFEHVPDDIKGYSECYRVLRKGGCIIFTVPLYDIERTEKIAYLDSGIVSFLGLPEYHDSRLGGAISAPVFWHHSVKDICERVRSVGFNNVELVDVFIVGIQHKPSIVIYGTK